MKKFSATILLVIFCLTFSFAEDLLRAGIEAPDLSLPDLSGKTINIKASQKPTVLFFFTTWSKPCQNQLQDLQKISTQNRKVEIIGVAFDKKTKTLQEFVNKNNISFTILQDKKLSALEQYQVLIIPTTFCLNQNGIIEKIFIDYDQNVKEALEEWVQKDSKQDE